MLRAEGITASFGPTLALDGVSFDIEAGELVAVVGRSGSGKSSLLHCLAGLVKPSSGTVSFEGQPVYDWSERCRSDWRLRQVGLVFQFGDLVPELTLAENIRLPLQLAGTGKASVNARVAAITDGLEISDVMHKRPGQVSGGQLQRAAIARALANRPSVILADEPTGALDTTTGQLVLEALMHAARDQGTAVVLVTHEARLSSYCDRELTMTDGKLAATPTVVSR